MDSLGIRIRELRNEKDVSQTTLGKYLGVGKTTVSNYETGYSTPDNETLAKLSSFFNVTTDYLLGISDSRNPKDDISIALESDKELASFWNILKEREDLKLLFKQTKNLDKKSIEQVIRIIKAIEDEEDRENG